MPPIVQTVGIAVGAYVLGCANAGYYIVRGRTGTDIRTQGSGNAGARNVGRVLGRMGFAIVFALDALKGAAAVWAAGLLVPTPWAMGVAAIAVIIGHVLPIQLQFKGGKGVSTAFGALLVLTPWVAIVGLLLAAVFVLISRQEVPSGTVAFMTMPALAWGFGYPTPDVVAVCAMTALLLVTHRDTVSELAAKMSGAHHNVSGADR
jgi:glycerol-3-phosphate acyltransferase PlsY